MTKMNRRDYLIKMSAGAGAIVAASELDIFAQRNRRGRRRPMQKQRSAIHRATSGNLRWPITNTPPPATSFITVIFGGLMGFCYNSVDYSWPACEIGFHPGGGQHKKDFKIYRIDPSGNCTLYSTLPTNKDMSLKVSSQPKGPQFYETDDPFFDRIKGDAQDFRWMPDLHGPDFYPEGYKLKNVYNNRLAIYDGTFYTWLKTNSKFRLADKNHGNAEIRKYGYVAMYMAAAIDAVNNNDGLLEIDHGTNIPLPWGANVRYQILLRNECMSCSPEINNPNEERRNDFHFNRKVLNIPSGRMQYAMWIDGKPEEGSELKFCPDIHGRGSDEAPCMGSGYGQSPRIP